MAYEVGLCVGENTKEPFTITKVLSRKKTNQIWCIEQGKSYPHDKAYEITLKCGKKYYTLNTQITKCIQRGWGWNKCKNCNGNKKTCPMDIQMSHTITTTPERGDIVSSGEIYGDMEAVEFAFNAKRHNYWVFRCTKCGSTYYKLPTNVKNFGDNVCSACSDERYKGPRAIREFLEKNNISFKKEVTFEDCYYKNKLPFDFAIYTPSGDLKMLIEFDGEQHFTYIPHWHGDEEGFNIQKKRDSIKTEYCKNNNIPLLRISYEDYSNIDSILKKSLFDFLKKI